MSNKIYFNIRILIMTAHFKITSLLHFTLGVTSNEY